MRELFESFAAFLLDYIQIVGAVLVIGATAYAAVRVVQYIKS